MANQAAFELEEFTRQFEQTDVQRSDVRIIPVVFHIIHAGGIENISNAQVMSAIDVMNEDFSANTPGISGVVQQFQSIVGDVGFEFRLAKRDPQGNCTNGIIRTINNATFTGGENLKTISPTWPRNRYMNVWVCNTIENGAAGYTFLPSSVTGSSGAQADGIVMRHDYVGRIGTSNQTRASALSHEVGHWTNLLHTWGQGNTPGEAANCNGDDGVSDTPNTIGWQSCNLNGSTCNSLDNVQNFMDYSYCYRMFTIGQSTRMRAALNSAVAQRNQLHTESNLTFTGVNLPDEVCVVDFETTKRPVICAGQSVTFNDLSFHGITTHSWVFEGGTPATSTAASPEITYSTPGVYSVTLTAGNAQGSSTATKQAYIRVLPAGENPLPYFESFESFNSLEPFVQNWDVVDPNGSLKWQLNSQVGYTGNKSAMLPGRNHTGTVAEIDFLDSPTFDLSNVSQNAVLRFKYAHARRSAQSNDRLRVFISRNCGDLWSLRRTINMSDLPTVPNNVTGQFVPSSQADWTQVEITNIVSVFLNPEFRVRFEFSADRGNNIYIDDIEIFDPATVSVDEIEFMRGLNIYPNPAVGESIVSFYTDEAAQVGIELSDLTGRTINQVYKGHLPAGEHLHRLNVRQIPAGIYLVRITANGAQTTRKLAVGR